MGMLPMDAAEPTPIAEIGTINVETPLLKVTELKVSEVAPPIDNPVMTEPLPAPIPSPLIGPIRKIKLSVPVPFNPGRLRVADTTSVPVSGLPVTVNSWDPGRKSAALAAGL
jgi:hypothetical protein